MEKKKYIKPQMTAMEFDIKPMLLAGSDIYGGSPYSDMNGDGNGYYYGD
ncbi:MAG: hypothetical protein ACI3ZD_15530 [Prevotella sp.]